MTVQNQFQEVVLEGGTLVSITTGKKKEKKARNLGKQINFHMYSVSRDISKVYGF